MTRRIPLPIVLVVSGFVLLNWAWNVDLLWAVWLVSVGMWLGMWIGKGSAHAGRVLCLLGAAVVVGAVVVRALPVYSAGVGHVVRLEIPQPEGDRVISLTDPDSLKRWEAFCSRGSYVTMLTKGYGYHVRIWRDDGGLEEWRVTPGCVGLQRQGSGATVFVPWDRGFQEWFESVLRLPTTQQVGRRE